MAEYQISGERWPYSTNKGAHVDQVSAGSRKWTISVHADDIKQALEKGQLFAQGVESSPHVWRAPILKIEQVNS